MSDFISAVYQDKQMYKAEILGLVGSLRRAGYSDIVDANFPKKERRNLIARKDNLSELKSYYHRLTLFETDILCDTSHSL